MKTLKKVLCIVLSCVLFGAFVYGCKKKQKVEEPIAGIVPAKETYEGTHILTAPDVTTDDYFIRYGRSEYTLVVPKKMNSTLQTAVEEFNNLLTKATGIVLDHVFDDDVTYSETAKYISLGNTVLVEQAQVDFDPSTIPSDGCRIITKGKSIFMLGSRDGGVINAVYDFMTIYFNYEYYGRDCLDIDKNVTTAKLKNFDVTDIPDILYRHTPHAEWLLLDNDPYIMDMYAFGDSAAVDVANRARRFRFNHAYDADFLRIDGYQIHNALTGYLRAGVDDIKPGWISATGKQICYSASSHTDHFDEENFQALARFCAEKIEKALVKYPRDQYPQYNTATLTQADDTGFCECPTCKEWRAKDNGALSGGMIRLNNAIIKYVKEWMALPENEPYKRDDLKLYFFAYNESEPAPVIYDEANDTYFPANDEVVLAEGTGVYYAAMDNMHYTRSIYDEINDMGREILKQWNAMTDNIWLWTYGDFYRSDGCFVDTYNYFNRDAYEYFAKYGVTYLFTETAPTSQGAIFGFETMFAYLQSKFMWNVSLNIDELIDNYMHAAYKDAADIMYDLFMDCRMTFAGISAKYGITSPNGRILNAEYYLPTDFYREIDYVDKAIAAIEKYKDTDYKLYYILKARILQEEITPLYCLMTLYGGDRGTLPFSYEKRMEYIDRMDEIAKIYPRASVSRATLQDIVESWR